MANCGSKMNLETPLVDLWIRLIVNLFFLAIVVIEIRLIGWIIWR